jgi:pyrimidine operon attenuation protein/uracil phosphoribosyltransferase
MDYGRPRLIELCVLIDRNGRELPIQANYSLKMEAVGHDERIDVIETSAGISAVVQSKSAPSMPPGPPRLEVP